MGTTDEQRQTVTIYRSHANTGAYEHWASGSAPYPCLAFDSDKMQIYDTTESAARDAGHPTLHPREVFDDYDIDLTEDGPQVWHEASDTVEVDGEVYDIRWRG